MNVSKAQIPYANSLDEVYPQTEVEGLRERWNDLINKFYRHYKHKPDLVARSPGRVNLIGEHIDYSLYNVLPMAVCVDVLVAVRLLPASNNAATVSVINVDESRFPGQKITLDPDQDIAIDSTEHLWTNYLKAGLIGAFELLKKKIPRFYPQGMELLMDGNIPPGGGLSSSAAFVCASALAVLAAHKYKVTQLELLELAIVSERLVGVNSGGMDQAASILSKPGTALHMTFYPETSFEHVQFPKQQPQMVFLVAQSFVTADKHVTAPKCYNLRVVECTVAAAVLAAIHGVLVPKDASPLGMSLRGFHQAMNASCSERKKKTFSGQLEEMIAMTERCLSKVEGYTRNEIANILGLSVKELEKRYTNKFPIQAEKFMLRQRALHVFSEALRVQKFIKVLSGNAFQPDNIDQLGDLMNKTQDSCRDLYDCSCPELDIICQIARTAGAKGSRLTGAGWGGCTVHLVTADKVDDVVLALKQQYYKRLGEDAMRDGLVISEPGTGSYVLSPSAQ